jgi:uncharacterized protein (DUF952 family)
MLVFKLLTPDEGAVFDAKREAPLSRADAADGYVHLSTAAQLAGTAERHFADAPMLWLLAVQAARLGDGLRWEQARGGELFPHFYGRLAAQHVVWSRPLARGPDGRFRVPEEVGA